MENKHKVSTQNLKKRKYNVKDKTTTKEKIVRALISTLIVLAFLFGIYLILYFTGTLDKVKTPEQLKEVILSGGGFSYFIFVVIQFLQVTFIPLPAMLTTVAGTLVFGPWITLGLSLIAVLLGSVFAFWLGRVFGRKLIVWIAGREDAKKWDEKLSKGKYLFFLMMLFPGFPDDILCMMAGATPMTFRFFLITNLITRPIVFASIVFLGSGIIIPYNGWGLWVWAGLIILMALAFYLSIKYQKQIEEYMSKLSDKISNFFAKFKKQK